MTPILSNYEQIRNSTRCIFVPQKKKPSLTPQSRISDLNIHKTSHLVLGNQFYELDLVEHALSKKDCIFYKLLTSYDAFELAVEYFLEKKIVLFRVYDVDSVKEVKTPEDIVSHCHRFVESVTIIDNHWFFITSFSVFIHDSKLDDCADTSRVGLQLSAVAFIRKKTRTGKDYFEFTLRFNNVELLATSGFSGCVDDDTIAAFVGSSVQGLPKSIIERYDTLSSAYIFITKAVLSSIAVEY
ncbi:unnamed protein product [Mucor hiemalis]